MNQAVSDRTASGETAKIIYILYLASILVGITSIVGLVMAYINRDDGPDWLRSHYRYQIRTFWIGFLYGVISGILCLVFIGFLLLLVLLVWFIVRCVKGLKYLELKTEVPKVEGWGF